MGDETPTSRFWQHALHWRRLWVFWDGRTARYLIKRADWRYFVSFILALHHLRYHTEEKSANHPPCTRENYMDYLTILFKLAGFSVIEIGMGVWHYGQNTIVEQWQGLFTALGP